MKQKNIFLSLLAMMLVAILNVGFVACDSDDDEEGDVIGTWIGMIEDGQDQMAMTFRENGTGVIAGVLTSENYTYEQSFTYKMESKSKGILIIGDEDFDGYGDDTKIHWYFEIEKKKMFLYEDGYGDEFIGILTKK